MSRHNREESFRCFVYQQRHNGYLLSQSAGANCNLYTATEGYRTMTLTKCEILFIFQTYLSHFRYVQSTLTLSTSVREEEHSCQFPSWLTEHRRYHSLGGGTSYSTNPAATVLTIHQVLYCTVLYCHRAQHPPGDLILSENFYLVIWQRFLSLPYYVLLTLS